MKMRALAAACVLLRALTAFASDQVTVRVAVNSMSGGSPTLATNLAATFEGKVDPLSIDASGAFDMTIARTAIEALRRDPRVRSVQVPRIPHQAGVSATWTSEQYVYDGAGNITQIGTNRYLYDSVSRIKSASVNGTGNTQTFTYDAFGNRQNAVRVAGSVGCTGSTDCESNPTISSTTNRITSGGAVYDSAGAGNLITLGSYSYAYDATSMMKSSSDGVTKREFIYTADDERLATDTHPVNSTASSTWTWTVRDLGQHVLREYTSSGTNGTSSWTWKKDYIWRDGALLATESPGNVRLHFHLDHLGTPRIVTNQSGQIVGSHDYYAFGTETSTSIAENHEEALKFTGHEWDGPPDANALTYMHARFYSATMGRFLSVDPTWDSSDLKKPQSWNRYAYVLNNPLNGTDPDGKCPQCAMGDYYKAKLAQQTMSPEEFEAYESDRAEAVALAAMIPDGIGLVSGIVGFGAKLFAKEGAEVLLEAAGKREVLAALRSGAGELGDAQRATAIRSVQRATLKETVTVSRAADGTVQILKSRPGRDGAQTIVTKVLKDGTEKTVQTASNAAGKMTHYDPKNTKTMWDAVRSWWYR